MEGPPEELRKNLGIDCTRATWGAAMLEASRVWAVSKVWLQKKRACLHEERVLQQKPGAWIRHANRAHEEERKIFCR